MKWTYLLSVSCVAAGLGFAQAPSIFDGGVMNGASFQKGQAITPGSLISIFGTALASTTAAADTIPVSTSLGGVTVTFVSDSKSVDARAAVCVVPKSMRKFRADIVRLKRPVRSMSSSGSRRDGFKPARRSTSALFSGVFASKAERSRMNSQDGTLACADRCDPGPHNAPGKASRRPHRLCATGLGALDNLSIARSVPR